MQKKDEIEILQQNEAYRKEFLQNLSHELKTPIFAIQGYVHTLIGGAARKPSSKQKISQQYFRNIDRLVNLVDDLDEISRLESGEQLLYQENFIIQELIRDVFETLAIKADEKALKVLIKKGCEVPLTVFADKEKIRQVIINLVDNAIKYGKQNGVIEASVYRIEGKKVLVENQRRWTGYCRRTHWPDYSSDFTEPIRHAAEKLAVAVLGLSICNTL